MMKRHYFLWISIVIVNTLIVACHSTQFAKVHIPPRKNLVFFLGNGMGITTLTAARIYKVGEKGALAIDRLPETGFVRTYSNNAQVTDSAAAMSAYMTGVKANNQVISMSGDTQAFDRLGKEHVVKSDSRCPEGNGRAVPTLLEIMQAAGYHTGVVTTTHITHATPAATYAHLCHYQGENTIAAQLTPSKTGQKIQYNQALGEGVDVLFGGGRQHFQPTNLPGGVRSDGRDLIAEFKALGYHYVADKNALKYIDPASTKKVLGLFALSHMAFDLNRAATAEPSLAEMTDKAIDLLAAKKKGFFLMVEGGRIDQALHKNQARKALRDTIAFDNALATAIRKLNRIDPGLKNTLIVVTANHDHTLVLNGYAKRTGPTTTTYPGVLGLVKNVVNGSDETDASGSPYTIISFGNGRHRPSQRSALTDAVVFDEHYAQEATIPIDEAAHSGTDVFIGAIGLGAELFSGAMDNTDVFKRIKSALDL